MAAPVEVAPTSLRPRPLAQFVALSKRSVAGSVRQLPLLVPSMLFPLFFVAINTSSFDKSVPLLRQAGYPKLNSFLTFTLAAAVIQGVLFGASQGATDLATDIEQGFFERMIAAPTSRVAIVISRLAGGALISLMQAILFTVLLVIFGARIAAGPAGALVLIVSATLLAFAFGSLLAAAAIKTGSAEVIQSTFPVVFILLFASSAFFPRQTMKGWFRTVAGWNPISHIVEGLRQLIVNGWSTSGALKALLIPAAFGVATVSLALLAMRARLTAR